MKRAFAIAIVAHVLASFPLVCAAQANQTADTKIVAEATKGTLKALKGKYFDKDFNASVEYEAEVKDLNGDGQPEVFTKRFGGMFGMAGVELQLYVKSKNGQWMPQFGFPGDYKLLSAKSRGYPDIEIQGPGTCFPVWRWNGSAYAIHKRCAR
jgi:hypothetical protein